MLCSVSAVLVDCCRPLSILFSYGVALLSSVHCLLCGSFLLPASFAPATAAWSRGASASLAQVLRPGLGQKG